MIKNTSGQKVGAQMVSATDGSAFTGAVTVAVTVDAGTQATGSVGSGACTHEGNGYHTYAPAQAETNGDLIGFTFTGTGAVPQTVQVYTRVATPDVNVLTIAANAITATAIQDAALTAAKFASGAFDAVWTVTVRTLSSISALAAEIRTALGLASANLDTQLGAIDSKTANLPTDPADQSLVIAATNAIVARLSTLATKTGAVVDDVANSATTFETNLAETADDHYKDCLLKFTSGTLAEQVKKNSAYNGTTKFVTVSGGFTAEPADTDTFEIIND